MAQSKCFHLYVLLLFQLLIAIQLPSLVPSEVFVYGIMSYSSLMLQSISLLVNEEFFL